MSDSVAVNASAEDLRPSREPQQGRSRASYLRMLAAAEQLMVLKGSDDFTLNEVSKVGKVSIGSIYLRFNSKDELVRAMQTAVLSRIDIEQSTALTVVYAACDGLDDFVNKFVEMLADLLQRHAPILRPIMLRASNDPVVSRVGKESHDRYATKVRGVFMTFSAEFGRPDQKRLVESAYRVIYSTLARYLGLGSSSETAGEGDWSALKEDLGLMIAAFLRSKPVA